MTIICDISRKRLSRRFSISSTHSFWKFTPEQYTLPGITYFNGPEGCLGLTTVLTGHIEKAQCLIKHLSYDICGAHPTLHNGTACVTVRRLFLLGLAPVFCSNQRLVLSFLVPLFLAPALDRYIAATVLLFLSFHRTPRNSMSLASEARRGEGLLRLALPRSARPFARSPRGHIPSVKPSLTHLWSIDPLNYHEKKDHPWWYHKNIFHWH